MSTTRTMTIHDQPDLDWDQALGLLRLKMTMTDAEHVLSAARATGCFDGLGLRVRLLSVSPERFEITEITATTAKASS